MRAASGVRQQRLAPLRLLDLVRAGQQGLEVAELVDQLGRGLDADAGHARHVVDRVAGQRLDVDHLLGPDAELLHHLLRPDRPAVHRVQHARRPGRTSCIRSLSEETMVTSAPASRASRA